MRYRQRSRGLQIRRKEVIPVPSLEQLIEELQGISVDPAKLRVFGVLYAEVGDDDD